MSDLKAAVLGTNDYHAVMQHVVKDSLQRQAGYIAPKLTEAFDAVPGLKPYLYWLRTGPADGNTFVMTRMMVEKSAMRFAKGYGWLCEYVGDNPTYKHKLSLPDEETFFHAMGFETVINPLWRGEKLYKAEWKGVLPGYQLDALRVNEPKQRRLL